MSNMISLDDAAKMLGLTVEKLNEYREDSEIFGYQEGDGWKFKLTEIQRFAEEFDITIAEGADAFGGSLSSLADDTGLNLDEDDAVEDDGSPFGGSLSSLADDDVLADDSPLDDSGSLKLDESGSLKLQGSSLNLDESGTLNLDESAVLESGELSLGASDINLAASDSGLLADDTGDLLDDVKAGTGESPSDTGALGGDMLLSEDDLFDDDLVVQDSASMDDSLDLSSDFDDSSDLVLDDSESSDIVLEASDSGIELGTGESGINLSDSMELGGSGIDVLDLPDDDDVIMVDDAAGGDEATMLQEDAFNLTPLEEVEELEASDSQIIALDDSEIYADESESASILDPSSGEMAIQPQMLPDDDMAVGLAPAAVAPGAVAAVPESPYTIYQIGALMVPFLILALGGMIAYDLCRNIWIPDDQVVNSGILKFVLSIIGMD